MKKIICMICAFTFLFQTAAVKAEQTGPEISAKSAVLMEASTGKILYESNPDECLPIASVTKIMTMLLIMEALDSGKITLDEMVTASERAKSMGGSTMFLETGEQLTVSDMLKGIAVASANDGAVAMAEHIAGSEEGFVSMMNQRAKELGMENTNFVNTNGLDDDNHYSSARDVALMSQELIKHPKIFEYTTIWTDSLRDGKFALANTNKLIRFYQGANGLKTGSTSKAMCCLSATAIRNDMQLIAVVLGSPTSKERFASASALLDYGFANYAVHGGITAGEEAGRIIVEKGTEAEVAAVAKNACSVLVSKGEQGAVEKTVELEESLCAPVKEGQTIGKVKLTLNGETLAETELVAEREVPKMPFGSMFWNIIKRWIHG